MAYTTREKIEALIPADFLSRGVMRGGFEDSGQIDLIIGIVDNEIDGLLASRYSVPFTAPVPAMVANAALILACDAVYRRNGAGGPESNPWANAAYRVREQLQAIADGLQTLGTDAVAISSFSSHDLIFDRA